MFAFLVPFGVELNEAIRRPRRMGVAATAASVNPARKNAAARQLRVAGNRTSLFANLDAVNGH